MINIKDFEELKQLIENSQRIKLIDFENYMNSNFKFTIYSKNGEDKPSLDFIIQDNSFRLINIHLKITNSGTGTEIFKWIIEYCNHRNLGFFKVVGVDIDNKCMNKLCKNFKMEKTNKRKSEDKYYCDYELEVN